MSTPAGLDPFGQPYEPPPKALDPLGWFIVTIHRILGYDKAAAFIGADPGDRVDCLACAHGRDPSPDSRRAATDALGVTPGGRP